MVGAWRLMKRPKPPSPGSSRLIAKLLAVLALSWLVAAGPSPAIAQTDTGSGNTPATSADVTSVVEAEASDATSSDEVVLVPEPLDEETERQFSVWSSVLDLVEEDLGLEVISLDALGQLRDQTANVRGDLGAFLQELSPRLEEARTLLEGLTTETETLVETPEIQAQRQLILNLEARSQPAQLLLGRATNLIDRVTQRRASVFADQLFSRTSSLVDPQLWQDGLRDLPSTVSAFTNLVRQSYVSVRDRATRSALVGLAALFVGLLVLAVPLRRVALRRVARAPERTPKPLERVFAAIRLIVISAGVPAIGFALLRVALDSVGGLSLRATHLFDAVALNVVLYFLISGIIGALLAPGRPTWRMVPVADAQAGRAARYFRLAAFAYAAGELLRTLAAVFIAPLPVLQLAEAVPVLVAALAILGGTRALLRGVEHPDEEDRKPLVQIIWRWTIPIAALSAFAVMGAQLLGFLAFAAFLVDRLVWTSVVLVVLHLGSNLVEHATNAAFQGNERTAGWAKSNIGLTANGMGQFGVLLSGAIKLFLLLSAASLIIAPFGVETGRFTDIFGQVFTGIEIGGFSFSLSSVLIALALIFVGIVVTRGVQGWLENRYLPQTSIDVGLKSSIRTAVGYTGVIIAAVIGLSYLGLNLENVALVAGALSVGIGFGLQSIVSNFVSGLILLAERPFKAGDWIVVGEEQGIVKRINVRATEIQTFDRATVLIPNSDFIAGTVKNRVHRDTLGRIDIPVGVGYDSDPEQVKAILLEVANAHEMTLSYPEPAAFFIEFGASSLDFMLFAYLADVGNGYGVRSDIRFEIFRRFKEEGIEIPFAQSDVTIRNLDSVMEVLAKAGVAPPEGLGGSAPTSATGDGPDRTAMTAGGVTTVPAPAPLAKSSPPRNERPEDPASDETGEDGPLGRD